jgi:hypothetical protein
METIFNTLSSSVMHPGAGLVSAYLETQKSNKFGNTSSGMIVGIIIIVVVAIALWIMSLVATYRLTNSTLQVVLCLLFGSLYLFFAWIYYGMTKHKLVKMSKA